MEGIIHNSPFTIHNSPFPLRRFAETDLNALAALMAAAEMADEGISRPTAEFQAELETAMADLARTGWLAEIDRGQVVGYNYLETVSGPDATNFWLRGVVHPDWRGQGVGCQLIQHSWADAVRQQAYSGNRPARINAWAYQHDRARCRLFVRFGLRPYHIYHELEIPAVKVQPVPPLPPDLIIRPWDDRHCAAAAALRNRAFAQNWGYQPTTAEALRRRFQTARYESGFSFTAWSQSPSQAEQMVGLIHACLGWTRKLRQANEAEIVWVAVAQEARERGIGQILMLTAMHALREAGAAVISVGADNYADRPAIGLYTKLGFTIRKEIVDYRGELGDGPD
jgi:mycothiol synthase